MKLGLIGYGGMGRMVAERAAASGHEIAVVIRSGDAVGGVDEVSDKLRGLDAVIDFSVGEAVPFNVAACMKACVPLVEGTTGWDETRDDVLRRIAEAGGAFVHAANFSVGVNLFYRIIAHAGELFAGFETYLPFIEEAHHSRKRDAPSGAALKLRELLAAHYEADVPVASTRAGFIPGTHRVGFDAQNDAILLTHTARTRGGFADGALLAAEWIAKRHDEGRAGVFEFGDVLDEIIKADLAAKGRQGR